MPNFWSVTQRVFFSNFIFFDFDTCYNDLQLLRWIMFRLVYRLEHFLGAKVSHQHTIVGYYVKAIIFTIFKIFTSQH